MKISATPVAIAILLGAVAVAGGHAAAAAQSGSAASPSQGLNSQRIASIPACQLQNRRRLPVLRHRAVGTEPFWGARIDGRCVVYSTPDNQDGVRIWTRFTASPRSKLWVGYYQGRRFELRLSQAPGSRCSDGMSDTNYPLTATLRAAGEVRRGCAAPS